MNFSNKKVLRTFGSADVKNAWGDIETLGWKKIKPISEDGVSNCFMILNEAVANNRMVSGRIDSDDEISYLFLH